MLSAVGVGQLSQMCLLSVLNFDMVLNGYAVFSAFLMTNSNKFSLLGGHKFSLCLSRDLRQKRPILGYPH